MKTIIKLKCAYCGKEFDRLKSRHNYHKKSGRDQTFCGRKCIAKYFGEIRTQNVHNMRPLLTRCKKNAKGNIRGIPCDLTLESLQKLWDDQGGKCAISGIPLIITPTVKTKKVFNQASVDRIDCDGGYTIGNVRIVALMINFALADFENSEESLLLIADGIVNKKPPS